MEWTQGGCMTTLMFVVSNILELLCISLSMGKLLVFGTIKNFIRRNNHITLYV